MRASTLLAAVLWVFVISATGADIHYADGRVIKGARILTQDPTYAMVMHEGKVFTVHAVDLTEQGAAALKLRPPTEEEIAARAAAEEEQRKRGEEQARKLAEFEQEVLEKSEEMKKAAAARPAPAPRIIHESRSIAAPGASQAHFQGRILNRLRQGAIAQGDGMPRRTNSSVRGFAYWITGTIYIREHPRLNATSGGTPFAADLLADGEFRYTAADGSIRVLQAWRIR